MAQTVSLSATAREKTGKGAARQARFQKQVPAVIYGHGRATQPLMVDALALEKALTGIEPESTLIELTVDGKKARTLIREIQRHPLRPDIDRKSTRLNSSHLVISYAVFCLKKKNMTPLMSYCCVC